MTRGEQTRQRIIERAAGLFNRRGYSGTALSDLMRATKLKKGGIYRHFDTKEDLAAEAFDHAWKLASCERIEGLDSISNTVDRLKRVVSNFVNVRPANIPGGCPLLNTAVDSDNGNPILRTRARNALRGWRKYIEATAREGMERNEICASADRGEVSAAIIAGLEGALMMGRLTRSGEPLETIRVHLENYLESNPRTQRQERPQ
jgi:TetR/AcrR family transcriptional repressor of nem operon